MSKIWDGNAQPDRSLMQALVLQCTETSWAPAPPPDEFGPLTKPRLQPKPGLPFGRLKTIFVATHGPVA